VGKCCEMSFLVLTRLNVAVCIVHFGLGLWVLIAKIALKQDWEIPVATTFVSWHKLDSEIGCGGVDAGNCYVTHEVIVFDNLARISLSGLVCAFHFLSFSWQLLTLVSGTVRGYYETQVKSGRNLMRWVEYSLSAPLMIIVIGVLLGIVDVVVLGLLAVCTCILMSFGHLQETTQSNPGNLPPHVAGWVLFFLYWSVISFVFWVGLSQSDAKAPTDILPVIYSVYFLMLTLFGCFGVVQAYQVWYQTKYQAKYQASDKKEARTAFNLKIEMTYVVLSLVSKSTLGLLVFWGVSVRNRILEFN